MRPSSKFAIDKKAEVFYKVFSEKKNPIFTLLIKEWETEFLKRKFGFLDICHADCASFENMLIHDILDELLAFADENAFSITETHCDSSAITLIPILEEKGFRMVDTRISFVTLIEKPLPRRYSAEIGDISFAEMKDLEAILDLTHKSFTDNRAFFSRYKNRDYFTRNETKKYYAMWIENYIADKNTLFAITKYKEQLAGYSFFYSSGSIGDIKLYKAILTAVDPDFQGHKTHLSMQTFLIDQIPEDTFYLDNTTQLTNFPAIKNSIISRKSLDSISMIFYRQNLKNLT